MSAGTVAVLSLAGSVPAGEHDRRVTDVDHVAIRELPGLHRRAVDGGAVGRAEVVQHRRLPVEIDVDVPAGDGGVGQPEGGILAATDDVRPTLQLVAATGAVIDGQRRHDLLRRRGRLPVVRPVVLRVLLPAVARRTLRRVALLVARVPLLGLALLVGLLRVPLWWVVGWRVTLLALVGLLTVLLFPLLALLVPHPLPVTGGVIGLRRVSGILLTLARARLTLARLTLARLTLARLT